MDGLLSFSDVQLYLGAAALLVGSCAIFFMDAAYRFFTSGRFDPFFQTLATFVLLIVIQLLVTIAALSIAFNNSVTMDPLLILALTLQLSIWIVTGTTFWVMRKWTNDDLIKVLNDKIKDPSHVLVFSKVATEFIDVEYFPRNKAIISRWSGNSHRRQLFIELVNTLNVLKNDDILTEDDLVMDKARTGVLRIPRYWLPPLTVGMYVVTIILVFRTLSASI